MRRADRLIKIAHFLRSRRRAVTAQQIADEFEICTRTVYRDINDLISSGAPISGEAGVGYIIDKQYYLPPVTFDPDELEALALGISMVRQWTDQGFAAKANGAFEKIQAILPSALQGEMMQITMHTGITEGALPWSVSFSKLRQSIRERRKIHISYQDEDKRSSERILQPLALIFFTPAWLLAAWCEKRNDFRNFRLDRIQDAHFLDDTFPDDPDKNLAAYQAREECI